MRLIAIGAATPITIEPAHRKKSAADAAWRLRVHENFSGQQEKRCFAGKSGLPLSDRLQAIPDAVASLSEE
jgi:hypothetical protein